MLPLGPQNKALAIVGAVVAIVGLLGVAGVVPLAVACSGESNCQLQATAPSISGGFSWGTIGLGVTFVDSSTVSQATVKSVSFSFGDGQVAVGTIGGTTIHTYAQSGVYNVTETLTGVSSSSCQLGSCPSVSAVVYHTVKVSIGNNSGGLTGPNNGGSGSGSGPGLTGSQLCQIAKNCPSVVSGFTWQANATRVAVQDASVVSNAQEQKVVWSWGDGQSSTLTGASFSAAHTYTGFGTYQITETVTAGSTNRLVPNATVTSSSSQNVTFSSGTSGGGNGPAPAAPTSSVSIGLLVGGLVLAVWNVLPGANKHEIIGVAVAAGAFLFGWLVL